MTASGSPPAQSGLTGSGAGADLADVQNRLVSELTRRPPGVRAHCRRVSRLARNLADRWGVDADRAALAGLAHDLFRATPSDELVASGSASGWSIHPVELSIPVLLHGPVSAAFLESALGVQDGDLLNAVRWHSTGREGMTLLEKVVFLADKLDPEKGWETGFVRRLRRLARTDLDGAILAYLDMLFRFLLDHRAAVHPASIAAWNSLLTANP